MVLVWRKNYLQGQAMLNAALQTPNLSAAERAAVKEQAQTRGIAAALGLLGGLVAAAAEQARKQEERAEQRAARKEKQIEAEMQALSAPPQEWKAAAQAYLAQKALASFRAQEQASATLPPKEQPRPWWQRLKDWGQQHIVQPVQQAVPKVMNWIDQHQLAASIGVGALVGAISIGVTLVVVGTVTLPVLAVAAGVAAVAAGVTVAAGTMGLNAHFNRPITTNIWNNVKAAAITAAAVTGIGLFVAGGLLTQAVVVTGNAIAGTCAANPAVCANAGAILDVADKLEEAALTVQLTVETATGNPHAGETAIELQLEQMDGGAPGNTVAAELGEQLAKLGDDVPKLVEKYGDDIVPLLLRYGDDAVDIIGAYGDEGITLLRKFGSDTPQAINLIKDFGAPAVYLLDTFDVKSAEKLLQNLDSDILDYAVQQGPDAVSALSKWEPEELKQFGVELALRAEKDAKALKALDELTKLDINSSDPAVRAEMNRLIQEIAENSTHGSGDRFVLGAWDDENGISGGYVAEWRANGGMLYQSHPNVYDQLKAAFPSEYKDILWQINQAALQKQIDKGMQFDYSLNGTESIKELAAIEAVRTGNWEKVVMIFGKDKARMHEVEMLFDAGYDYIVDWATNTLHWVKP